MDIRVKIKAWNGVIMTEASDPALRHAPALLGHVKSRLFVKWDSTCLPSSCANRVLPRVFLRRQGNFARIPHITKSAISLPNVINSRNKVPLFNHTLPYNAAE